MEDTPHVFFAANQPAFDAKRVRVAGAGAMTDSEEDVLVVSVPRFASTGEAVLVDLKTLDCAPIKLRSYEPSPSEHAAADVDMETKTGE
jgi:DNA polymerase II small subunit/DNA polymerase delta subunit B